jgi:hypothetical protein
MSKFKIGDKVRITKELKSAIPEKFVPNSGLIGEIISIFDADIYKVGKWSNPKTLDWWLKEENLELVAPETTKKNSTKIKVEKVYQEETKMYRIISIEGVLSERELPIEYINTPPNIVTTESCFGNMAVRVNYQTEKGKGWYFFSPDSTFTEDAFKTILDQIKEAGDRLHSINQKREKEKEKENWKGEETFTI